MTNKTPFPLDLNTADETLLVEILHISPRLAKRIISLRPFQSVDQLQRVWGLDPETLQRISPLVGVGSKEPTGDQPTPEIQAVGETQAVPETQAAPVLEAAKIDRVTHKEEPVHPKEPEEPEEPEEPAIQPQSLAPAQASKTPWKINALLVFILLIGAYFRFSGLGWDENQHQHPDERFVTMVAEQIRGVNGPDAYFDTSTSTLNPLKYGSYTYGMLPLFFTRMVAEWVKMTGYDTIVLVGRAMSGLFDLMAVWMLYLLGTRLYNRRTGLLAAALGAAAVLPIQLSHYFAVDSFSTVFVVASFYFAIQAVPLHLSNEKFSRRNYVYFGLFGLMVGLAGACKVNTLPVFGIILIAGMVRLMTAWKKADFRAVLKTILLGSLLALFCALLTFRIFQPYAFSGPGFLGIELNQRWLSVLREVTEQVAGNSDWPPNTHWTNRPVTYAWTNIVNWGLGLPLGLVGFIGWAWAAWRIWKGDWRRHLLPFVWVGGYFIWQNIQFWRYMRYFLPIYPFIILFAAWALMEIYDRTRESRAHLAENGTRFALQISNWRSIWKGAASLLALAVVVVGTYGYAFGFSQIYTRPMSRIAASRWMLANFQGPLNVIVDSPTGVKSYPVSIDNRQIIRPGNPGSANIRVLQTGSTTRITSTDIRQVGLDLIFQLTKDEKGGEVLTQGRLAILDNDQAEKQEISFGDIRLTAGETYYLQYKLLSSSQFSISNVELRSVDQEQPVLPVKLDLQNQAPGKTQGTLPINPGKSMLFNRLVINKFLQTFVPTETSLKVKIFNDGDENTPLVETSQTLAFTQPGASLTPTFEFPPVELTAGQNYRVRYEITGGASLQVNGESFTLETSWDDALPLNVDRYAVQGGIFSPLNLELYEADTPAKREAMLQVLSASNYIVIPSNRAYDAMPRLPLRYPMTLKYYQALFDCECQGDDLENRAYGLEPPFKSPLGFDLVATFESPPSIGFLGISDQSADESFTVYDHPKVMIFKKSPDFSMDRVSALLNSVDLDQVIFQTPYAFGQAPTAMRLSADRLLAQRNGGTWAGMFDRLALLNQNETLGGVAWYVLLFLLGLMVFPGVFRVFSGLPDRGYPLMRITGLILTAWVTWFLGSFKILPFSQYALWVCIAIILALNILLAYRQRDDLLKYFRAQWKHILTVEVIFLAVFLVSLSIRLGNPDLWNPWLGGEKPMNLAFFNAVLKAVYFPPENPWFSGNYINYYYYGYVIAAIPTKLLGILPTTAYNLVLPSWFAMSGIGMFSAAFNLIAGFRKTPAAPAPEVIENKPEKRTAWLNKSRLAQGWPYFAGLFALIAVMFLGNLYEVQILWKHLPELTAPGEKISSPTEQAGAFIGGAIQVLTGQAKLPGGAGRWYFDASRPILHDGPDTPIAEFPYFTFLYGDMHPHLLTMPIYGLALAWMIALLLRSFSQMKWGERILFVGSGGLIFGAFRASHTWDFPTFVGLAAMVILWDIWRSRGASIQHTLLAILGYELALFGTAAAMYWPFTESFHTEYASLQLWDGLRTPLGDYLVVFGLILFVMISLLVRDFSDDLKKGFQKWLSVSPHGLFTKWHLKQYLIGVVNICALGFLWLFDYQVLTFGLPILVGIAYLVFIKREIPVLRRITWILYGVGLAITLLVEVIVLKGDTGRANMVFRFYNQAWFIFGLAMSLSLVDLLASLPRWAGWMRTAWLTVLIALFLGAGCYALLATQVKMNDRWPGIQNPPHSLDGSAYMLGEAGGQAGSNPAIYTDENRKINLGSDYAALQYLQEHAFGSPVIVEANTEEYRWGSRFSIYTGLPSVVGWSWHTRQHNSLLPGTLVEKRIAEVKEFYNTQDVQKKVEFLTRFQVKYIIVGDLERGYYDAAGLARLQDLVQQGVTRVAFNPKTQNPTIVYEVVEK